MFGAKWAVPAYVDQNEHWIIYCTGSFVFMAGMTGLFSRNPALHGARLLAVAAVFPIVTAFFFDGSAIYFGVLHLLAVGMLFYAVAQKVIEKIPWWGGLAVCVLLFAFILVGCSLAAGAHTFRQGFWLAFGLMCWIGIYDTCFLDWVLFANLPMFRLEGTEHMDKAYHQKWFHVKGMLFPGIVFALIPALIVGWIVMLL